MIRPPRWARRLRPLRPIGNGHRGQSLTPSSATVSTSPARSRLRGDARATDDDDAARAVERRMSHELAAERAHLDARPSSPITAEALYEDRQVGEADQQAGDVLAVGRGPDEHQVGLAFGDQALPRVARRRPDGPAATLSVSTAKTVPSSPQLRSRPRSRRDRSARLRLCRRPRPPVARERGELQRQPGRCAWPAHRSPRSWPSDEPPRGQEIDDLGYRVVGRLANDRRPARSGGLAERAFSSWPPRHRAVRIKPRSATVHG